MSQVGLDAEGNLRVCNGVGWCGRCGREIKLGQPYTPMVPFVGSWGGFMHRHCPGVLTVLVGAGSTA